MTTEDVTDLFSDTDNAFVAAFARSADRLVAELSEPTESGGRYVRTAPAILALGRTAGALAANAVMEPEDDEEDAAWLLVTAFREALEEHRRRKGPMQ